MVERLVTQFRGLLGGRGADAPVADDLDDLEDELAGLPGPDPEWDELLAWAREADDEVKWTALIARAKQTVVAEAPATDEAAEWSRLLGLAKSRPTTSTRPTPAPLPAVALRPTPAPLPAVALRPTPATVPLARPPVGSMASLSARLERLAAQVPDARRRRAR